MPELTKKERERYEVINRVINKELTQKQGAYELGITDRQVRRLIKIYEIDGQEGFIHKNRGKTSDKKTSNELKEEIINCYIEEYLDYNFTHFYEDRGKDFEISQTLMRNIFKENDIISPYAQHKTVREYNQNMRAILNNNTITEQQKQLYEQRQEEEFEKHIRRSCLQYLFGEQIQMDAAFWIWFGDIESALHLAVDKATKKVLYGWFDYQETTECYMILLMNILIIYGIPKGIKTDKRSSFSINNARSSKSALNVTQFGRICEDLEIDLKCSSDPLFKPNVERENGTFKRRLKAELRHEGITAIEEANKYLNEVFIPKINDKFSYGINPKRSAMRENNYTDKELNIIISIKSERTVDNASSIKYFSNYYLPIFDETGEVTSFPKGTKCTVIKAFNKTLYGLIDGILYSLYKIGKPEVKPEQNTIKKEPAYKGHKPAPNHPWVKHMM